MMPYRKGPVARVIAIGSRIPFVPSHPSFYGLLKKIKTSINLGSSSRSSKELCIERPILHSLHAFNIFLPSIGSSLPLHGFAGTGFSLFETDIWVVV